jgi:hypothetical protein
VTDLPVQLPLRRPSKVRPDPCERPEVIVRPPVRFEDDRRAVSPNEDALALESKLLWQSDRLASTDLEELRSL